MNTLIRILSLILFLLIQISEVMAGPGGSIAKGVFSTPIGKIIGILLFIVLFPLIVYIRTKEFFAKRATLKVLRELTPIRPDLFNITTLRARASSVFMRIHVAWAKQDLQECAELMSPWYWQNQKIIYLDRWETQGLVNVSNVRKMVDLSPLYIYISENPGFEESTIVFSITANMMDYLQEKSTGRVIEGKKRYQEVETVWTFEVIDGEWRVINIEEDSVSLAYARLKNFVPANVRGIPAHAKTKEA